MKNFGPTIAWSDRCCLVVWFGVLYHIVMCIHTHDQLEINEHSARIVWPAVDYKYRCIHKRTIHVCRLVIGYRTKYCSNNPFNRNHERHFSFHALTIIKKIFLYVNRCNSLGECFCGQRMNKKKIRSSNLNVPQLITPVKAFIKGRLLDCGHIISIL